MTLTFENHNDVIVYALERIISYARQHQYIFVAHSVWWIASIIGLTEGLTIHIDNLRSRSEVHQLPVPEVEQLPIARKVSATPRDLQEDLRIGHSISYIHPDRMTQVENTINSNHEGESVEPESDRATSIIQSANKFIGKSRKERRALDQGSYVLSRTRSGKVPIKPLTKKQRNRLQAIPKDTISAFLAERKN